MSLQNIFQVPEKVDGFGEVFPIRLKEWDKFESSVQPFLLSKNHLTVSSEDDYPLLDRLVYGLQSEEILNLLCNVFNLISRTDSFTFHSDEQGYFFYNNEKQIVDNQNFDQIRMIILKQNILFEPKIYKSEAVKRWAEKVLKARQKNSPNVTIEDMLSTVSVLSGKHYWDLAEYSIYQLKYDFNRACKIKTFDSQSMMLANPYGDFSKMKLEHFAENIDMYENPYDGLFKEKSSKLDTAIK